MIFYFFHASINDVVHELLIFFLFFFFPLKGCSPLWRLCFNVKIKSNAGALNSIGETRFKSIKNLMALCKRLPNFQQKTSLYYYEILKM